MPLPNPAMDFTALDPLTAAEMDDIVENIEALADGTAIDDDVILSRQLNVIPTTDANGWKVYDFGSTKMYTKRHGPLSAGSTASLANATLASSQTMPAGVAANTLRLTDATTRSTGTGSQFWCTTHSLDLTSASTSSTFTIMGRNVTGSSLTPDNLYYDMTFITI